MRLEELLYDRRRDGRLPTVAEFGLAEQALRKALATLRSLETRMGVGRAHLTRATTEWYLYQKWASK